MCWFQNTYHFWKLMNFYGSYERLKILISTFSLPCRIESDARLLSRHAQDQGRGRGRGRLYWVIFFSQTVNCCMIWIKKKSRRYLYFSLSERHLKKVRIYLPHPVHIYSLPYKQTDVAILNIIQLLVLCTMSKKSFFLFL